VPGGTAPDGGPFLEAVDSRRVDGGFVGRWLVGSRILSVRGSAGRQSQDRRFGVARERGVRTTWFSEVSLRGARGRHAWVAGSAFQQDQLSVQELPRFDYRFAAPAVFAQDDVALGSRMTLAVSARADLHSEYGALVTPRVSLLARPAPEWTIRVAGGTGAFTPTPFTDETDETGLGRLRPLRGLRAERARGAALDVTRTFGPLEVTGTVFGSVVHHPLQQRIVSETQVELVNADGPTRTRGTELLVRYRGSGFVVLATHAWTRATEVDPDRGDRRDVPLTPGHSGSLNVMWEGEDWGRAGIEVYYTGRQSLDENPYRARGRPYTLLGALAERRWGAARFFINVENLFDTRQTSFDLLTRPVRRPDGRWTVDAWAPLEGRVVNGGVRVGF
jgi:iron complex outermembrane receptor protein